MEEARCNLCNSENKNILFKEGVAQIHQIVQCNNCGLMYAFPLKINKQEKYWEGTKDKNIDNLKKNFEIDQNDLQHMIYQKEKIQVKDFATSIDFVEEILGRTGKALEIGSSRGFFLNELCKRGWEVIGIEPSETRLIDSPFKYKIFNQKFEDIIFPENSFDVIFLFHVIEHLLDPSEVLSKFYKILKTGGVVVIETPTYDTISFKILKHRERSLWCSGHFFFFTKNTLRRLCENNQFKIIKHDRVGRTLTLERLFWNFTIIFRRSIINRYLIRLSKLLRLEKVHIYISIGDMQRIYCKK